jgi:hypothetical protein
MRKVIACAVLIVSLALPARGQILGATVNGNTVSTSVWLLGLGAQLTVSFEDVTGLSLGSLGISAQLVNTYSPALLARLPAGVVPALPLLLRIEPPAASPLAFHGIWTLDLHTENLTFYVGTPLRLYTAPIGGRFDDMTVAMGPGSYRARGTSGGFSEFLIVLDLRTVNQAIAGKLDRLDDELEEYAASMPSALAEDLASRLAAIRSDVSHGNTAAAIQKVDGFLAVVTQHSGTDIPDLWRAARDVDNVAGYLRGGAMTLRFSLALKNSLGL